MTVDAFQPGTDNLVLGIVGADGYIGRHLMAECATTGTAFVTLPGDVAEPETFAGNFDTLVYLAFSSPEQFQLEPEASTESSLAGTANALAACKAREIPLVFASSAAVYASSATKINERAICAPESPYGTAKLKCEELIWQENEKTKSSHSSLRIFNCFGPGQPNRLLAGYFEECCRSGTVPRILNPAATRDFVHVEDVARSLIQSAKSPVKGPVNIGSGHPTTVFNFWKVFGEASGSVLEPEIKNLRHGEDSHFVADIAKAENELGWKPGVSLREGIAQIVSAQSE